MGFEPCRRRVRSRKERSYQQCCAYEEPCVMKNDLTEKYSEHKWSYCHDHAEDPIQPRPVDPLKWKKVCPYDGGECYGDVVRRYVPNQQDRREGHHLNKYDL